jgi:hypothetical protein
MINNNTDSNELKSGEDEPTRVSQERPNESTGIYVRGFLKITDPESGEVIVQTGN